MKIKILVYFCHDHNVKARVDEKARQGKSLRFASLPLVAEGEEEEDILLELTFSPPQTGTTTPSSTCDRINNVLMSMPLGKVQIKQIYLTAYHWKAYSIYNNI